MIPNPHNQHQRPARRLFGWMAIAVAATIALIAWRGPTLVLWNASASVPVGLYVVQPDAALRPGDLAVTHLPAETQHLAATRHYLPSDVLLIKPVAAVAGSEICRQGNGIYVDGMRLGEAQSVDRRRRPLPDWQGCRVVTTAEIFLMNPDVRDSFDGRYFGPISRSLGRGRAIPILTFPRSNAT
jgi:conjugative transfer signal peptidase TraF